jgi:hypothetical protein
LEETCGLRSCNNCQKIEEKGNVVVKGPNVWKTTSFFFINVSRNAISKIF